MYSTMKDDLFMPKINGVLWHVHIHLYITLSYCDPRLDTFLLMHEL